MIMNHFFMPLKNENVYCYVNWNRETWLYSTHLKVSSTGRNFNLSPTSRAARQKRQKRQRCTCSGIPCVLMLVTSSSPMLLKLNKESIKKWQKFVDEILTNVFLICNLKSHEHLVNVSTQRSHCGSWRIFRRLKNSDFIAKYSHCGITIESIIISRKNVK